MKIFKLLTVLLFVAFFSANVTAAGFVKFEGIDGESTDAEHKGWIDVLSMDWGMLRKSASTGQSRRRGAATFEDIQFRTNFNLASPRLMQALASGEVLPRAEIHFEQTDREQKHSPYLVYRLTNVQISGYHFSVGSDDMPIDDISFNYEEIEVEYVSPDTGAESMFQWRLDQGR